MYDNIAELINKNLISDEDIEFYINSVPYDILYEIYNDNPYNSMIITLLRNNKYDLVEKLINDGYQYKEGELLPLIEKYDRRAFELYKKYININKNNFEANFIAAVAHKNFIYIDYIFNKGIPFLNEIKNSENKPEVIETLLSNKLFKYLSIAIKNGYINDNDISDIIYFTPSMKNLINKFINVLEQLIINGISIKLLQDEIHSNKFSDMFSITLDLKLNSYFGMESKDLSKYKKIDGYLYTPSHSKVYNPFLYYKLDMLNNNLFKDNDVKNEFVKYIENRYEVIKKLKDKIENCKNDKLKFNLLKNYKTLNSDFKEILTIMNKHIDKDIDILF